MTCISSFTESGTTVLNVTDSDLCNFMITMDICEKIGYGRQQGILKMRVDQQSRGGGTKPKDLLNIVKNDIGKICVLQEFRKYPSCNNAFGYKAITPVDKKLTANFVNKMGCLKTYSEYKTCCSEILIHGSVEDLAQHYFHTLNKISVNESSGRSQQISYVDEEVRRFLETGQQIRARYNAIISTPSLGRFDPDTLGLDNKPFYNCCECEDCFTESETENEECSSKGQKTEKFFHHESTMNLKLEERPSHWKKYPKYSAGLQLPNHIVKVTENFGLSLLFSVLNLLPHKYRGLQVPNFYIGEEHSTFAAHAEDAFLYAANYLHFGHPKIWITIPEDYFEKTTSLLASLKMELAHTSCRNSINHKFYLPTSDLLEKHGIPFHITLQGPGELVILYPKVIHFGFSTGPNVAEAVNFGTVSWIPKGMECSQWRCRCYGDLPVHMDLRPLVAAFYPDMFRELYNPSFQKSDSQVLDFDDGRQEDKEVSNRSSGRSRKVKIFACPHASCSATFKEHRQRLVEHVRAKHPEQTDFYLTKIAKDYPQPAPSSTSGRVCPVCGSIIIGSVTHLVRHMKSQLDTKKLDDNQRKLYSEQLIHLHNSIKRRHRSRKT